MTENLQRNFHQEERKQSTDAKMWAILGGNVSVKNAP